MTTTKSKSKSATRLKLAAANARASLALHAESATGIGLAALIVLRGYQPNPTQFAEALAAAKAMRRRLHAMSYAEKFPGDGEHPLVSLDDQLWFVAGEPWLTPEARAIVRASGHRTPAPACGQPMPTPWAEAA